jgi:hypothetical protein
LQKKRKKCVALRLAAEEAEEQAGRFITPWEMELEMLEDWLNNPEPARELTEFELSEEKRMTEQQVSQRETAELKTAVEWQLKATDEDEKDGMGDHDDLSQWPKSFAAEETAKAEPATGAAGPRDRGHQKADVEVSTDYQRREAG